MYSGHSQPDAAAQVTDGVQKSTKKVTGESAKALGQARDGVGRGVNTTAVSTNQFSRWIGKLTTNPEHPRKCTHANRGQDDPNQYFELF